VALAALATSHCLCGRQCVGGAAVCQPLLTATGNAGDNAVVDIARTLLEFARTDGGFENVRKLEDARLAAIVAPFVRGRAHCVSAGRWFSVSPPPASRWSCAEDDGAQIMCIVNDRVLPAVTRLRQHLSGSAQADTDPTALPETARGLAGYQRYLAEQLLRDVESTLRKHDARRRIVREVALLPGIYDPDFESRLDADTSLLGFDNCVFDLVSGVPREARASDHLSRSTRLQFPLGVDAATIEQRPTVQRILWRLRAAMPRDDEFQYLLHVLASCFVGERSDLLHIWLGGGANMKTQTVRLIKAMLGSDYFVEIEPEMLTRARPSTAAAAPDILMLAHKRCVCMSEICAREQLRTALLKRLTGDETLVARDLYSRHMIAVQPIATWLLLSNHDVDIAHSLDERHAIARRVRRLHFRVRFVNRIANPDVNNDENEDYGNNDDVKMQSATMQCSDDDNACADGSTPNEHDNVATRQAVPKAVLDREFAAGAADFAAYLLLVILPKYRQLQRTTGTGLPAVATINADTRAYLEQFDCVLEWFRAMRESGALCRVDTTPPVAHSTSPADLWRAFREWNAASNNENRKDARGAAPRRQAFQQRIDELLGETAVSCGARRYRYLHWQFAAPNAARNEAPNACAI
jgi:hypothetical protein